MHPQHTINALIALRSKVSKIYTTAGAPPQHEGHELFSTDEEQQAAFEIGVQRTAQRVLGLVDEQLEAFEASLVEENPAEQAWSDDDRR